jgi:N-acetyl-gamma-glutamyl-phosphate/LysW-gamma-L-alpha-aminoadipyl-6-phosphate reductase
MIKVAIFGASGYVANELIRLLLNHEKVEISFLFSETYKNKFLHQVHPNFKKLTNIRFLGYDELEKALSCDLVFLASTYNFSLKYVPIFLKKGLKVIDLTPMFRLKNPEYYQTYYKIKHPCPELLEKAVYGLPEINRELIKGAKLVACPGCIATSSIIALYPLIISRIIKSYPIIIDAKMGSSGSGSRYSQASIYSERANSIRAYKPTNHRHTPEIEEFLSRISKEEIKIALSAHSINIVRGLLATIHCFFENELSIKDLWKIYRSFYSKENFIRIVREEKGIHRFPDPKNLIGSNYCDIGFDIDERNKRIVLLSALDNLTKGAAGNAIQSMNIMFNMDEKEGLKSISPYPI